MIGSVIIPTIEGTRPILIETQALVTDTVFTHPIKKMHRDRSKSPCIAFGGFQKNGWDIKLHQCDVFVSIAGGMRITSPESILESFWLWPHRPRNRKIDPRTIVAGEVGLGGEIRSIVRASKAASKKPSTWALNAALSPNETLKESPKN